MSTCQNHRPNCPNCHMESQEETQEREGVREAKAAALEMKGQTKQA